MRLCNFVTTKISEDNYSHACAVCGRIKLSTSAAVMRACDVTCPCLAGCQLSNLLSSIGIIEAPGCQCAKHAAEMDANGAAWCKDNIDTTVFWMAEEARRQGLVFVESQARWLAETAIRLAEEQREPTRMERVRLRAMRLGNRLLNR